MAFQPQGMQVFLRNVPEELTQSSLEKQLVSVMQSLAINLWICDKPKNKSIAFITFYHVSDGHKFLARHGEICLPHPSGGNATRLDSRNQRFPPTQPRLRLLGKGVYCKENHKRPDYFAWKGIIDAVDRRRERTVRTIHEETFSLFTDRLECGHYMYPDDKFTFIVEWNCRGQGCARFTKSGIVVNLPFKGVKVHISYRQIMELLWSNDGTIAVTLHSVPTFVRQDVQNSLEDGMQALLRGKRSTPRAPPKPRVLSIDQSHARFVHLCLVYRFSTRVDAEFAHRMNRLKGTERVNVNRHDTPVRFPIPPVVSPYDHEYQMLQHDLCLNQQGKLPFEILFSLQALVNGAYLHPSTVRDLTRELKLVFDTAKQKNLGVPISVDAMKRLFDLIPFPGPFETNTHLFRADGILPELFRLETQLQKEAAVRVATTRDTNQIKIFRATVTPTRITLRGPEWEATNRVLRKYPAHHDHFLRVELCDEDTSSLRYSPRVSLDDVYARFKDVLDRGISIAGRQYNFLGFSHSSLRSRSLWMSAPFVADNTLCYCREIVMRLGDFEKIRCPARQAARIGQAFSETPYAVPLDETQIAVYNIKDVTTSDGKRVFSDGVGPISLEALRAIWPYLPSAKNNPTCFQIRFAGVKGMLSLDTTLEGKQFHIRPSMQKFESSDMDNLEICDMGSKAIAMVLNRSLIKILEDMGAPHAWFLQLQGVELRRLRNITSNALNTSNFLKKESVGQGLGLSGFLRYCDAMGLDYKRDPFLRNVVEVVVLNELHLLKHKARIPVPRGITLFGIMDETGLLAPGQVYVTYDRNQHYHLPGPEEQVVLVTRSPALHPGDVQQAYNVVPPEDHPLAALSNCIVFSSKGDRDLPSQLSGGDLDGDLFHVIWDPKLVNTVKTFQPADYPRVPPRELDRQVTDKDITNFFVDFMETDHLGVIATRHLILADHMTEGTLHPHCMKLAALHSTAVDFSKTGIPVEMEELPKMTSKWRPDFLAPGPQVIVHDRGKVGLEEANMVSERDEEEEDDSPHYNYYRSEKILGIIYREVDEQKVWHKDIKTTIPTGGASFWDDFLLIVRKRCADVGCVAWHQKLNQARQLRHVYEDQILDASWNFALHPTRPLKELEVFVGLILNRSGWQSGRQRDQSIKLREQFEYISANIVRQMRTPFDDAAAAAPGPALSINGHARSAESIDGSAAGGDPSASRRNRLDGLAQAMACVEVGCMKDFGQAYRGPNDNFVSFRVLAAATALKELRLLERAVAADAQGGGYVGVSQGGRGTMAVRLQIPRALVPDQVQAAHAKVATVGVDTGITRTKEV